jgi:hypothetical protein
VPRKQPDAEVVYFVDRCLGEYVVPDALRKAGARIELHSAHFSPDAPDTEILAFLGTRDWVFLSKDTRVRRRKAELEALSDAKVAAFIVTSGNASGEALASALTDALQRMTKLCATHARPIIGAVSLTGTVSVLVGSRKGGVRR